MIFPPHLTERRFRVTREAIRRYADISEDYNPIHLDPDYAARTPMGGVIAHGMLSLSLIWQSLGATFGVERMAGVALQIRFVRPVRENDWVIAGGALGDEPGTYEVWVRAEAEGRTETVIAGTAVMTALDSDQRNGEPG
jgi:acyl dehydratase